MRDSSRSSCAGWIHSWALLVALLAFLAGGTGRGQSAAAADFETANRLYFEGKYAAAAAAYQRLIEAGPPSAVLWFNLGNAWFKSGQHGRAIAAYLQAQRLTPREPNLRFNLKFVREQVTGSDQPVGSAWERALASLTLNEWAGLCAAAVWMFFLLLILREVRPAWRATLRSYVVLTGLSGLLLVTCLCVAWRRARRPTAVVVASEAIVRQGPLDRAAVAFKLRDGSEVVVKSTQTISDQGRQQTWLQIQDAGQRLGWVQQEEVLRTGPEWMANPERGLQTSQSRPPPSSLAQSFPHETATRLRLLPEKKPHEPENSSSDGRAAGVLGIAGGPRCAVPLSSDRRQALRLLGQSN